MYRLVFGLPGTGKTTYIRKTLHSITLDVGAPRDDNQRKQLKEFTTEFINKTVPKLEPKISIDSFPEYFDLYTLEKSQISEIVFMIPSFEDYEFILERIETRDGKSSPFYQLYKKNFFK